MVTEEGGVEYSPHQGKNRGQKSFQKEVDALQFSILLPQSFPTIVDRRVQSRSKFDVVVIGLMYSVYEDSPFWNLASVQAVVVREFESLNLTYTYQPQTNPLLTNYFSKP